MKLANPEMIVEDFKFGVSKPNDYAVPVCCSHMYEPILSLDDAACFYLGIQNQDGTWSLHQKYVRSSDMTKASENPLSAVFSRMTEAHRLSEDALYNKMKEASSLGQLVAEAPESFFFEPFARQRGWEADQSGTFYFAGEALPEYRWFSQNGIDARRARLEISQERLQSLEPVFIDAAGWKTKLAKMLGKNAKDISASDWKSAVRTAVKTHNIEAFVVLCDMVQPQRIAVSQEQVIANLRGYSGQLLQGGKFDKLADLAAHLEKGSAYAFVFIEQLAEAADRVKGDFPAYYELLKIADGSPAFLEAFDGKVLDDFHSKIYEAYAGRWDERYALEADLIRICVQSPELMRGLGRFSIRGWHRSACEALEPQELLNVTQHIYNWFFDANETFFGDQVEVLVNGAAALLEKGDTGALAKLAENEHIEDELAHFMRSIAALDDITDDESYAIEQQLRRMNHYTSFDRDKPFKALFAETGERLWSKEEVFSLVEVEPSPRPTAADIAKMRADIDARNASAKRGHGFGTMM